MPVLKFLVRWVRPIFVNHFTFRELAMSQWWGHSPPTSVARVRFPDSASPYVRWVCCWFSSLLREVFLRVLRFFPSLQKPTFSEFQFDLDYCQALYRLPLAREIAQALPVLFTLNILSLHFTSLHFTSPHFTSLHFTSLHFTSLHFTSLYFTLLYFTLFYFTLLYFTLLY